MMKGSASECVSEQLHRKKTKGITETIIETKSVRKMSESINGS